MSWYERQLFIIGKIATHSVYPIEGALLAWNTCREFEWWTHPWQRLREWLDENHNLEERARRANSEGHEFGEITVKRSLPAEQVGQIVKEMWFDIISRVNAHIPEFERSSGRPWRIGNIVYGVPDAGRCQESRKGSFRDEIDDVLGGMADVGLAGAEKISLTAEVTLKSPRP